MREWMGKAHAAEKAKLARSAGTSIGMLRQIAGGYRTGGRANANPVLARRIEIAAQKLAREGLPELRREDLCQACGRCELARQARGQG